MAAEKVKASEGPLCPPGLTVRQVVPIAPTSESTEDGQTMLTFDLPQRKNNRIVYRCHLGTKLKVTSAKFVGVLPVHESLPAVPVVKGQASYCVVHDGKEAEAGWIGLTELPCDVRLDPEVTRLMKYRRLMSEAKFLEILVVTDRPGRIRLRVVLQVPKVSRKR